MVFFSVQQFLRLIKSHLFIFVFIFITLGGGSKKILLCQRVFCLCFSLRVFFNVVLKTLATAIREEKEGKRMQIGKDSDAGRDWGQEEKGTIEDEMAGWHH